MAIRFPALQQYPLLPARRVIAIDPGSHSIKVLLVEQMLERPRILLRRSVDLPDEGLLSPEEFSRHLKDVLTELGPHPIAIPLAQTQTMSVVVDVPPGDENDQRQHIEDEVVRIRGLSEAAVVFDHVKLRPYGRHTNPFWVTLCQEPEISARYGRLGLDPEDLCEVTTEANALMAAYRVIDPSPDRVVLVDVGATRTVMAIFHQGQGVHASAFASGSASFTEAILAGRNLSADAAENLKRSSNLLGGGEVIPALRSAVQAWHKEIADTLKEWLEDHRELELKPGDFKVVLAGGGAREPGLIEYLRRLGGLDFVPWPVDTGEERDDVPAGAFAVAFGAAAQALGCNPQSASLLPLSHREGWRSHRRLHVLQSINASLMAIVLLLLLIGSWQKFSLLRSKRLLLDRTEAAVEKATATASFARRLVTQYERQQPILESQRFTHDALKTLALLQQARSNRNFWFVSLADQPSYFSAIQQGVTNPAPAVTNLASGTNLIAARPALIAEVCIPEEGEAQRRTLSSLIGSLKRDPAFANVDLMPADRVRPIVDPKITIPGRVFTMSLELTTSEFPRAARLPRLQNKPAQAGPENRSLRSMFRPGERPFATNPPSGGAP